MTRPDVHAILEGDHLEFGDVKAMADHIELLEDVARAAKAHRVSQYHLSRVTKEGLALDRALAKLSTLPEKP